MREPHYDGEVALKTEIHLSRNSVRILAKTAVSADTAILIIPSEIISTEMHMSLDTMFSQNMLVCDSLSPRQQQQQTV